MRRLGRDLRQRQPSGAKTLSQKVAAILRTYGTGAHVYLPGIGVINGLTAGNYLGSAGTTAATADNPVGLVLDGAGSVGAELITNGTFTNWSGDNPVGWLISPVETGTSYITQVAGGARLVSDGANVGATQPIAIAGKTYRVTVVVTACTGTGGIQDGSGAFQLTFSEAGTYTANFVQPSGTGIGFKRSSACDFTLASFSVKEVTGIHATQATTANKPVLRMTNGRYWWDMVDGTDLLTATYPAGYESATVINALASGQQTLTAQNIVGTYNIGPSVDTYGRFIFRTGLTASELTTMQTFANRLAGV